MGGVGHNPTCTPQSPGAVQVLKGRKAAANHLLSRAYDTLQSALVLSSGSSVADGDGGGEDGLDVGSVEVHNHRLWQVELLQLPQEEHPLFELLLSTVKTNYIYYLVVVIFIFFSTVPWGGTMSKSSPCAAWNQITDSSLWCCSSKQGPDHGQKLGFLYISSR